jgi:hypothetical protein
MSMFNRKQLVTKLQQTSERVAEQMSEENGQATTDYGQQLAAAIQSYATMTADFIEDIGEQMVTTAEAHHSESKALADNIRKCAELEAQRTHDFVQRMRDLGSAMARAKETFEKVTGIELGQVIMSPQRAQEIDSMQTNAVVALEEQLRVQRHADQAG